MRMATAKRSRKSRSATNAVKAATTSFEEVPISPQDVIRLRAYGYYEQRGCEHGHDLDDWLVAEAEVVGGKPKAGAGETIKQARASDSAHTAIATTEEART
jgi:hypothetical protein